MSRVVAVYMTVRTFRTIVWPVTWPFIFMVRYRARIGNHMAGRTKVPPVPIPSVHGNIILPIDTGPQQPFFCGTMGFMAVGAGKHIVIVLIWIFIRGCSVTPSRVVFP
jgi:hypothetical protein